MSEQAAATTTDEEVSTDPKALRDLMRKFEKEIPVAKPKKAERKEREKKMRSTADGRSLRAKGRTTQYNVMIKPEIKQAILARAAEEGISMADWTERAFLKELGLN
jgi:hypothetical protein